MLTSTKLFAVFLLLFFVLSACRQKTVVYNDKIPPVILWAWEREEDLKFIDSDRIGVAYLAQTIVLQGGDTVLKPRRQPLQVNENTYLIAVTRIETNKQLRPDLSEKQMDDAIDLILKTLQKKNVKALQIDFDVVTSERDFYRKLLNKLRPQMAKEIPLTITALASFCIGDTWYGDLPVDEAVPMIFRMGADDEKVKKYLISGKDFNESLCLTSYGLSLDEPINTEFRQNRRFYIFNNRSWNKTDLDKIYEISKQK
jgi:hypothetical protein